MPEVHEHVTSESGGESDKQWDLYHHTFKVITFLETVY